MLQQEKQYAALAPIMALAGVFAHPAASTILPLVLFFIFNRRKMEFARMVALRAADLAFSIQLFLILASVLLATYLSSKPMPEAQAHAVFSNITLIAVAYLIVSLVIAAVQSLRGLEFKYILSLKIAERILIATRKT